jgi:hypothetical protein
LEYLKARYFAEFQAEVRGRQGLTMWCCSFFVFPFFFFFVFVPFFFFFVFVRSTQGRVPSLTSGTDVAADECLLF